MTDRLEIASRILAGLVANPSVIGHNEKCGWKLVNCDEEMIAAYAYHLASYLIEQDRTPNPQLKG